MSEKDDDNEVWGRLKKTVRPLKNQASRHVSQPQSAAPPQPQATEILPRTVRQKLSTDLPAPAMASAGSEMAGIDRRTEEKLRRGQMPIDARLDLHGMTQAQAHKALQAFVDECRAMEKRVLLVITGKGGRNEGGGEGVLRKSLPQWLKEPDMAPKVLSFKPARPQHGGTGAFYVLLRRQRPKKTEV